MVSSDSLKQESDLSFIVVDGKKFNDDGREQFDKNSQSKRKLDLFTGSDPFDMYKERSEPTFIGLNSTNKVSNNFNASDSPEFNDKYLYRQTYY